MKECHKWFSPNFISQYTLVILVSLGLLAIEKIVKNEDL